MGNNTARLTLAEEICLAIHNSGLSLHAVARLAGVDHTQLGRLVRGERTVTLHTAQALCDALGLRLCQTARPAEGDTGRLS